MEIGRAEIGLAEVGLGGIGRRGLLLRAGALLLAALGMPAVASRAPAGGRSPAVCFRIPEDAAWLGWHCLARLPGSCSAESLARTSGWDRAESLSPDARARLLARRRRDDFARGDVVLVDGLVLARAEAALFALVALHA